MSALTDNEIAVLIAANNWGPGAGDSAAAIKFLDTAIAVCRAESGGDPDAPVSNTGDYGLWQINRAAHARYFPPQVSDTFIWDPFANTRAAKDIYTAAHGWTPWTTYKTGAYKDYRGHGAKAYKWLQTATTDQITKTRNSAYAKASKFNGIDGWSGPGKQSATPSLQDYVAAGADKLNIPNPLDIPNMIFGKVYEGMKTVGIYLLALIVLILGFVILVKDTTVGRNARAAATDAAKVAVLA